MRCDEAGEYVSAMVDGEAVPPDAAEHIEQCPACQALRKNFAEMGAEVRSLGSLALAEPLRERAWVQPQRSLTTWWEKGWAMMRVPRIAFASLVLLLVVLGSRLALVEVRAHEDGSVLLLKLTPASGEPVQCSVPLVETDRGGCGGLAQIPPSNLFFSVKALRKEGDRVLLSVRAKVDPIGPAGFGPDTAASLPETQMWFTPGQSLAVPNTGALQLQLSGQWSDHVPVATNANALLDPGPNEIRMTSPLLLKNNKVAGDLANASGDSDQANEGVAFYVPGEGRFLFSSTQVAGATLGTVKLNRVSFESQGQSYVLVTGMPITRAQQLWVLHEATYKPSNGMEGAPFVAAGPVGKLL